MLCINKKIQTRIIILLYWNLFSIAGTKLIYERAFLKDLRGSPLSQTPPSDLPTCLLRGTPRTPFRKCVPAPVDLVKKTRSMKIEDHEQFQLEL